MWWLSGLRAMEGMFELEVEQFGCKRKDRGVRRFEFRLQVQATDFPSLEIVQMAA